MSQKNRERRQRNRQQRLDAQDRLRVTQADELLAAFLREHGRESLASQLGARSTSDVDMAHAYARDIARVYGDETLGPPAHHGALAVLRSVPDENPADAPVGDASDQFVALARKLGCVSPAKALLAVGRAAAAFAEHGPVVLHQWIATGVEPHISSPEERKEYVNILSAAGIKLCPEHLDVLQPEIQRLSGG